MQNCCLDVRIAYAWDGKPQQDAKYAFLREVAEKQAKSVEHLAAGKKNGLKIDVSRLRATHGGFVYERIKERINKSDVVICDLEKMNPNVLIELGMALNAGDPKPVVFIFIPETLMDSVPSDMNGFMLTEYSLGKNQRYAVKDAAGFSAALRASLIRKAREKGCDIAARASPITPGERPLAKQKERHEDQSSESG